VQLLLARAREAGRDAQVDLRAHLDLREVGLVGDRREVEAVGAGAGEDARHREQLRHVGTRLARQLEVEEVGRPACRAVALHRAQHRLLAAVVGGDGLQPVAIEHRVQLRQVVERRARRVDDVAPAVLHQLTLTW